MYRRDFVRLASQAAIVSSMGIHVSCDPSKNSDADAEPELTLLIPKLLEEFKTPGLSIAIIRNGTMTWNKAFGVKDNSTREAVDVDTTFEAASVSKTVFAYAVMKLCEKGVMHLDQPLRDYYPELFSTGDPRMQIVTARQVLSHQTGLPNWREGSSLDFQFNPGADFMYSGEGYYYLQTVVTHLVGKTFSESCGTYEGDLKVCATDIADYLSTHVLIPMDMTSSSYLWTEHLEKNSAHAHDTNNVKIDKPHQNAADMARYASAGGLMTSAKDYSKFLISLFNPKDNNDYRLNAASIAEMHRPQVKLKQGQEIDACTSWALGWGIQERPTGNVIVHSGGQTGFRSLAMASVAKKSGFVALTNGDNGGQVLYRLLEPLNNLFS